MYFDMHPSYYEYRSRVLFTVYNIDIYNYTYKYFEWIRVFAYPPKKQKSMNSFRLAHLRDVLQALSGVGW